MKLLEYLNSIPAHDREAFADGCGTSFDYLRQIGYGNRTCKEGMAIKIERESNGAVPCEELCPYADWAYIRSSRAKSDPQASR